MDVEGNIIGNHNGYPFYTVGQRKGLGIAFGVPKYVTEIRPDSNTVVLGDVDDLMRNGIIVDGINLMKYDHINDGMEAKVMIRYNDKGTMANIYKEEEKINVEFLAHVRGVAPGQSAVFYEGDDVLGGGIIQASSL